MNAMLKKQNFGVEVEMTGITRAKAADLAAELFGTYHTNHIGGCYDTYIAYDAEDRKWQFVSDASIRTTGGRGTSCEMVTPVLKYEDIELLQNLIRKLRENGAVSNASCGVHVHVDGANHDGKSLCRLVQFFEARQDLIYEGLKVSDDRKYSWCCPITTKFKKACMKERKYMTIERFKELWYSCYNDARGHEYRGGIDSHSHYNPTRYHALNLHSFYQKMRWENGELKNGTVEFRLFNGTTHAGKIKAYVQFCLAISAFAITASDNVRYCNDLAGLTKEQRARRWNSVIDGRLELNGEEFATCRKFITEGFAV